MNDLARIQELQRALAAERQRAGDTVRRLIENHEQDERRRDKVINGLVQRAEEAEQERDSWKENWKANGETALSLAIGVKSLKSRLATAEEALRAIRDAPHGITHCRLVAEYVPTDLQNEARRALPEEEGKECDLACFKRDHMEEEGSEDKEGK